MSNSKKIKAFVGVASLAAIGTVLYVGYSRRKTRIKEEKLERVSEEGYEFAEDVLFPLKQRPIRKFF
jgi:hypothetical protein